MPPERCARALLVTSAMLLAACPGDDVTTTSADSGSTSGTGETPTMSGTGTPGDGTTTDGGDGNERG